VWQHNSTFLHGLTVTSYFRFHTNDVLLTVLILTLQNESWYVFISCVTLQNSHRLIQQDGTRRQKYAEQLPRSVTEVIVEAQFQRFQALTRFESCRRCVHSHAHIHDLQSLNFLNYLLNSSVLSKQFQSLDILIQRGKNWFGLVGRRLLSWFRKLSELTVVYLFSFNM